MKKNKKGNSPLARAIAPPQRRVPPAEIYRRKPEVLRPAVFNKLQALRLPSQNSLSTQTGRQTTATPQPSARSSTPLLSIGKCSLADRTETRASVRSLSRGSQATTLRKGIDLFLPWGLLMPSTGPPCKRWIELKKFN